MARIKYPYIQKRPLGYPSKGLLWKRRGPQSHQNHISDGKTAFGKNWSSRWTCRVFATNTRRGQMPGRKQARARGRQDRRRVGQLRSDRPLSKEQQLLDEARPFLEGQPLSGERPVPSQQDVAASKIQVPRPEIRDPKLEAQDTKLETWNPKPEARNPKPET